MSAFRSADKDHVVGKILCKCHCTWFVAVVFKVSVNLAHPQVNWNELIKNVVKSVKAATFV